MYYYHYIRKLLPVLLLTGHTAMAQYATGLSAPAPDGGPGGTGPTTASQVVTLYSDAHTPSEPPVQATYRLSRQQYNSIEGHPDIPGIVFGAGIAAGRQGVIPDALYLPIQAYGTQNSYYTACPGCDPGTGIDITTQHAIQIQSFTDALIDATGANRQPVDAKVWFADLTIDFSVPVTNPVLHFTGLGAWVYKSMTSRGHTINYDLGIAAEFDLLSPGYRLSRLSGSPTFDVVSGTMIKNTATFFGDGNPLHGIARSSASGSVVVAGTAISSLTFRISIKGDGGIIVDNAGVRQSDDGNNFVAWSLSDNTSDLKVATTAGDGFLIGLSIGSPGKTTVPEAGRIRLEAFPATQTIRVYAVSPGDIIELSDAVTGTVKLRKVATGSTELLNTGELVSGLYTVNVYSPRHREKHSQKVVKW